MRSGNQKTQSLKKPSVFMWSLLASFILIFGGASFIGLNAHRKATHHAIRSNETRANLLAKTILEHQMAAIGVLRSYVVRPEVIESVKKKDFEETAKHLSSLVKDNPELEIAYVADPAGIVWVNFPVYREGLNKDMSHRDWYKGVSKAWTPYVSSAYKTIVGEKDLAVSICAPIRDEKDSVIGILCAAQTTVFFNRLISQIGLNDDSNITLTDQEGHMIYSNRFPYKKEVILYSSFSLVVRAMGQAKGKREGNVEIRDPSDGNRVKYISVEPIEGIGWKVFVEKEKSEVLRSELTYFIQIGVISVLLFTAYAFSLAYYRQRHKQAAELRLINAELEERVRQRTAELQANNRNLEEEISGHKQAEEALRESEERLSLAVQGAGMGTWDADMRTGCAVWSHTHFEIFGYPPNENGEATVEMWLLRVHPDDLEDVTRAFESARTTDSVYAPEYRIIRADNGEVRWLSAFGNFMRNDAGEAVRFVGIFFDNTERKLAEEALQQRTLELQQLTGTLEKRVKERTAELADLSSQLVSAQENERRRVSYDLHDNAWQELVNIRFEIERLFSGQEDWAALQTKSKKVMAAILDAVGTIRSMQGDLWPYVLDDIGIVATIDWYCREFEKNHPDLTIERVEGPVEDEISSSAKIVIYRILQETLSNVAKHSQASHVTIRLMKNDHGMEFTVEDNGIGFDLEEAIAKRTPWGGLGLLNMKARTELSGGIFGVESIKGKGTIVRASWPFHGNG